MTYPGLMCPERGLPLVPFGGEDICTDYCDSCHRHDCVCWDDRDFDETDPDDGMGGKCTDCGNYVLDGYQYCETCLAERAAHRLAKGGS